METSATHTIRQLNALLLRAAPIGQCFASFSKLTPTIQYRCYELLFRDRIIDEGIDQFLMNPKCLLQICGQFGEKGRQLEILLRQDQVDLQEAFVIFQQLPTDQQMRCYELLCREFIIEEGIDEFLADPAALLKEIRANGRTLPIIDHLVSATLQMEQDAIRSQRLLREFHAYVRRETPALRHKAQTPNIRVLLQNTVCQAPLPQAPRWRNVPPLEDSPDFLRSVHEEQPCTITSSPDWFTFTNPHHFYLNAAHATEFGGAYDTFGCVQEERLFAEFPELPFLKFMTNNGVHPCVPLGDWVTGSWRYPPFAVPSPAIIEGVRRQFDISRVPYGGDFHGATAEQIRRGIVKVRNPVPVNILGIAAVDWRGIPNPMYRMADLQYHFLAAFLGYQGANDLHRERGWPGPRAVVHTLPWGCGAFLNSIPMITAIQCLAAKIAGVDLVFHGIDHPTSPGFTREMIDEVSHEVSVLLAQGRTTDQILRIFFERSKTDPLWAPKEDPSLRRRMVRTERSSSRGRGPSRSSSAPRSARTSRV